ncbi:MAG: hypothetical protein ACOC8A_02440 [bacterium]
MKHGLLALAALGLLLPLCGCGAKDDDWKRPSERSSRREGPDEDEGQTAVRDAEAELEARLREMERDRRMRERERERTEEREASEEPPLQSALRGLVGALGQAARRVEDAGEPTGPAGAPVAPTAAVGSPRDVFQTMVRAARRGDKYAMLDCFSRDTRQKMENIARIVRDAARRSPEARQRLEQMDIPQRLMEMSRQVEFSYGDAQLRGERASLEIITDGNREDVNFVREGGSWKIVMPLPDESQVRRMIEAMSP